MGQSETYTDQFFAFDPWSPPAKGSTVNFVKLTLTDQNGDGDFDRSNNDSIDGKDITSSYAGDTVTIDVQGVGHVTYTGVTFYLSDGRQVFTPNDGQALQSGKLVTTTWVSKEGPLYAKQLGPVCFTPGTLIRTTQGLRRVDDLKAGECVLTRDHGPQRLLGLCRERFAAQGSAAPVLIREGALGNDADLIVSQQHRMLITDWRAEVYCGAPEVLVAARHLVDGGAICMMPGGTVDYLHLRFEHHEIVTAAGIPSESLFPEFEALKRQHPRMTESDIARPILRSYEGMALAA